MNAPTSVLTAQTTNLRSPKRNLLSISVLSLLALSLLLTAPAVKSGAPQDIENQRSSENKVSRDSTNPAAIFPSGPGTSISLSRDRWRLTNLISSEDPFALEHDFDAPLGLAAADFDEDGVTDLVGGYRWSNGGAFRIWRGAAKGDRNTGTEERFAPFSDEAHVSVLPFAADFVGAGDFNADGHADVVAGQLGGNKLLWMDGDGRGRFEVAGQSDLPGTLNALTVGELNRSDGLPEVVVGMATKEGAGLVQVLEGPQGAKSAKAETFAVSAPVSGLALGMLDGDAMPDVALAAGRELLLISGRDRKLSLRAEEQVTVPAAQVSTRRFVVGLRTMAVGDFTGDGRLDVAVLTTEGSLQILRQPTMREPVWANWPAEVANAGLVWAGVQQLVTVRVTGLPLASVVAISFDGRRAQLLKREGKGRSAKFAANGRVRLKETQWVATELAGANGATAVLPLRVNGDAYDDLVVVRKGASAPMVLPSAAAAIFIVNSSADPLTTGVGGCVSGGSCTLREAINAANASPGLDEVRFNIQQGNPPQEEGEKADPLTTNDFAVALLPAGPEPGTPSHRGSLPLADFLDCGFANMQPAEPDAVAADVVIGGLDPTFGGTGKVSLNLPGNDDDSGQAVAIQADGKVLIGGRTDSSAQLVRYDSNGSLDRTFGLGGFVPVDFDPAKEEQIFDIRVQTDGKIVVFGGGGFTPGTYSGNSYTIVARLNSNGTFDQSFGTNGKYQLNQVVDTEYALGGAIQADGKILSCGFLTTGAGLSIAFVQRLLSNGVPDPDFDGDGLRTFTFGTGTNLVQGIVVQPDNKIVVAGYANLITPGNFDTKFAIARLNPNGVSLDPAFGTNGQVIISFPPSTASYCGSLALQSDGKIVLAGGSLVSAGAGYDINAARLNPNGSLDTSFDGDGRVQTDFGGDDQGGAGVTIQRDGKIVVSGYVTVGGVGTRFDFAAVRYNIDGSLDTSFDGDGKVRTQFNANNATAFDVVQQVDDKLLLVGTSKWASNDFGSVRYNLDGSLDRTWGGGKVRTDFGAGRDADVNGVALQTDGKYVVVGTSANGSNNDFGVARYNVDGSLDATFDDDGMLRTNITLNDSANDVVVQQDGRILVAGITNSGSGVDFALVRYNTNGSLDANFDGDGKVITAFSTREDTLTGIAIQPADGRIVAVGQCHNGTDYDVCLARYLPDGSLDPSFDGDGRVIRNFSGNDQAFKLAIQPDGKIVTSGFTTIGGLQTWAVYRFNANGSVETSFDGDGVALTSFDNSTDNYALNLTLQSDGKIVTAGRTRNAANGWDFALARYNTNGSPDTSFSSDGKLTTVFSAADDWANDVAIQADGKIVAAGKALYNGLQDFVAARYLTDGQLDSSFGINGQSVYDFFGYTDNGLAMVLQPDGKAVIAGESDSGINSDFALMRILLELPTNCTYSISPSVKNIGIAGGNDFVSVTTAAGCSWVASVSSNASWLTITGGSPGNGNGLLTFNVAANGTGNTRTGTMNIAGQTFTVIQSAQIGCVYTIAPISSGFIANGGTAAVNVTTDIGCSWTAVSNAAFVTITPASASGTGNGTVLYTVQANGATTPRTGTLTIAGQTFTISQGGLVPGLRTITLTSALPRITQPIIIDGAAGNPFFNAGTGVPVIEVTGKNLTGSDDGLYITAGSSTIRSLTLSGFTRTNLASAAIRLITNGNNFVEGCYVGSDASGAITLAPSSGTKSSAGIAIQSSDNNTIGGTTVAQRNLISGNDGSGIAIFQTSSNNKVQGNYIGTDITGTVPLGVQDIGVNIQNSSHNTIGGAAAAAGSPPGNLISGNGSFGVFVALDSGTNLIQGNRIGTNGGGTAANANGNAGVLLRNPDGIPGSPALANTVGGTGATMGNQISGNGTYGVIINPGATGTLVQGNFIGTNAAGSAALSNLYGLAVTQATGTTIGGDPVAAPNARNVISGNTSNGIFMGLQNDNKVGGTGVTVQNNYIGTNAAGTAPLGNQQNGVFVEVESVINTIVDNVIAFNGNSGVRIPNVTDVSGTPGFKIDIGGNLIYANTLLGIDLGEAGITANDPLDADAGANLQQNFPVLNSFSANKKDTRGGNTSPSQIEAITVNGSINSTPNSQLIIDYYFANASTCPNSQQTVRPLLPNRLVVMTDAQGNASFSFPFDFPPGITSGVINAKATSNGNTSEFSLCLPVTAPPPTDVQFGASGYTVSEAGVGALITVTRSGLTSGASSVDFAASDGSATQNQDYVVTSGTLNFAAGETSKAFLVLIVDDAFVEGSQSLNLTLSNAVGASLVAPSTATLTITDNETANSTSPAGKRFAALLDGGQETPANNSTAKGTGYVLLNGAETSAQVGLQFQNLGSAEVSAHIHNGSPGVAGPILFTLAPPIVNPIVNLSISPTAQQVVDLKAGLHYLDVHSTNFPNGEIRGQLRWSPTLEETFFVRQQYLDFLSRDGDPGGFNFWVGTVSGCAADAQCFHDRSIFVSNAFFFEAEFQQTAGYVFRVYRAAYGNNQPFPNPDGSNATEANKLIDYAAYVADRARVVGGANLAEAQLAFANQFVLRSQFTSRYGPGLNTAALFVDAILTNIQTADGVNLAAQRQILIDQYTSAGGGNAGRGQVLYRLADDNAQNPFNNQGFINAEYNRQFALTLYFGYLRRNPDIGGFLFWQSQINSAPLRNVDKQNALVCSFLTAAEYQFRFGPSAPRSNAECPQ